MESSSFFMLLYYHKNICIFVTDNFEEVIALFFLEYFMKKNCHWTLFLCFKNNIIIFFHVHSICKMAITYSLLYNCGISLYGTVEKIWSGTMLFFYSDHKSFQSPLNINNVDIYFERAYRIYILSLTSCFARMDFSELHGIKQDLRCEMRSQFRAKHVNYIMFNEDLAWWR